MATLSRLLRRSASVAGLLLLGLVGFDVAAYFAFPALVREIESDYAVEEAAAAWPGAGEASYYRPSPTRGFDIAPGARSVAWHLPEVRPYDIWGNALGCFDDEPAGAAAPDVYFAGDSFTWGFAPYEAKFGTILERETGLRIHACGVNHTGQRHQFEKFLEVSGRLDGWPELVIVNVYTNDIANDFAHPHSTVRNGVLVDTVFVRRGPNGLERHPVPEWQVAFESSRAGRFLKAHSATANIVDRMFSTLVNPILLDQPHLMAIYSADTYPIRADLAAPNREAVQRWLRHSREQGYDLVFSLIPERDDFGTGIYGEFEAFLKENGGRSWSFERFVLERGARPEEMYWPLNLHFTPLGNAVYAEFLLERIRARSSGDGTFRDTGARP